MRKTIIRYFVPILTFYVLLALSCPSASAQSATSKSQTYTFEDMSELFMPPELYVNIDFDDDNHNRILEALESGVIRLTIQNRGGASDAVSVSVTPERMSGDLTFTKRETVTKVAKDGEAVLEFPIKAGVNISTDSLRFDIKVSEPMGYDIDAAMVLSTYEYLKSRMHISGVSIIDGGRGLRAMNDNPDGKVQKGEVVKAVVTLQNIGIGTASGVRYVIESKDPNVYLMTDDGGARKISGSLDDFLSGEARELSFRLSANNNYVHKGENLPVYITVREDRGFGDLVSEVIPIPLDSAPKAPTVVDIHGEQDRLLAMQQTKIYSSSSRISSTSAKIRDISQAPVGVPLYSDAVAVVIGAETNSYGMAPAPYAARDAEVMSKYFKNTLGVSDITVKTDAEVTGAVLSDLFDPDYGYLKSKVVPGQTDVFVFYSGHGIPDTDGGKEDVYLLPYDARKELIRQRGYSLNELYASLNSLNARSVTVILDACFSGSSRFTASRQPENISSTKGVRIAIDDLSNCPWTVNPNFRLFASSAGDQTSLGYDQSQSGLFTYYLALGLQGDADTDGNGSITFDELVGYVTAGVSSESRKIRGGDQTPQFYGTGDFVIGKIK